MVRTTEQTQLTKLFLKLSMKHFHLFAIVAALLSSVVAALAGVDSACEVLDRFFLNPGPSSGSLILGPDGNYWGTGRGGTYSSGVVYKVTPDGVLTMVTEFTGTSGPRRGAAPEATLLLASDGNFYGRTQFGGQYGNGTVFQLTPGGALTTLVDFTGPDGTAPGYSFGALGALVEGGDGHLYGTTTNISYETARGGVFRLSKAGVFTSLATFTGGGGELPGDDPTSGLVRGLDGHLYGATDRGGNNGRGTFFRVTTLGEASVLHHFEFGPGVSNRNPLVRGLDGNFYGTTDNSKAVLYKVTPTGVATVVHNFEDSGGQEPVGALALDPDGSFVGVTERGGGFGTGTFFRCSPAGAFQTLYSFPEVGSPGRYPRSGVFRTPAGTYLATVPSPNDGYLVSYPHPTRGAAIFSDFREDVVQHPLAPLTGPILGAEGELFGTADQVNLTNLSSIYGGAIYRVKADGTIVLHAELPSESSGIRPGIVGRLLYSRNSHLYGAAQGSSEVASYLFSVAPDGAVSILYTFPSREPPQLGGGLIEDAAGNLYGTTLDTGASRAGTIFRLTPDGTFTTLAEFTGGKAGPARGARPIAPLLLASDGNFYGTTTWGGAKNLGGIFRLTPAGELTTLVDFTGKSGAVPGIPGDSALVEASDGTLFGVTIAGGASDLGTLFRLTKSGQFTNLVQFSGNGPAQRGAYPNNLLLGPDGGLYGTCAAGGSEASDNLGTLSGPGTVFRFARNGLLTTLIEFGNFPELRGGSPLPGLAVDGAGAIYGTMSTGYRVGQPVFKVTPDDGGLANTVIAVKGGAVPGEPEGSVFGKFGPVTHGSFLATLVVGKKKTPAIFAPDGSVRLRLGGAAPGLDGTQIAKLGVPNGDAVLATLKPKAGGATAESDELLIAGLRSGPLRVAAREGVDLDGLPGVSVKKFGTFDGQGDAIFFLATLQGASVTPKNDSVLCAALGDGRVRVIVREGQTVEGQAVSVIGTLVALKGTLAEGRWRAGSEAIGVRLTLADKSRALYTIPAAAASPAEWTRWIGTGDTLADAPLAGAKVAALGFPSFSSDGPAFTATLAPLTDTVTKTNDTVLFRADAGGLLLLARESEPATNPSGFPLPTSTPFGTVDDSWKIFGEPVSGRSSRFAFVGKLINLPVQDIGLWYADDGTTLRRIAQKGSPATGGGTWSKFLSLALPDELNSGPIFTAKLATKKSEGVAAANALGLWAVDRTGRLRRLLRAGEQMLVGEVPRTVKTFTALTGSPGSLGAASGYDTSHVTILATFTDKTQAIINLAVP